MLVHLYIRNYALIDELNLEVKQGLTILTGETGAGKSILLGAIKLLEGGRLDTSMLYSTEDKCVVEATFNIQPFGLQYLFESEEIEYIPDHTIIRREIQPSGKSRAFVNDTPVSLDFLKKMMLQLIDIHSQHDHLLLLSPSFQLQFIDRFSDSEKVLLAYQKELKKYKDLQLKLANLTENQNKFSQERDYWTHVLNELEQANVFSENIEALEQSLDTLENAQEYKKKLEFSYEQLYQDRLGILAMLKQVRNETNHLPDSLFEADLKNRLESAYIELVDIARSVQLISNRIQYNPLQIEETKNRLDRLQYLLKKHRCVNISQLQDLAQELKTKLDKQHENQVDLDTLSREFQQSFDLLKKHSQTLSEKRSTSFNKIEKAFIPYFKTLNMPEAKLAIEHQIKEDFSETGQDRIILKIQTNRGKGFAEIQKSASGGELSRVMLALKCIMAQKMNMPTLIFDEIDTGISGATAHQMGALLEELASKNQVWVITHLPQVASKGETHLKVYKEIVEKKTYTRIKKLNKKERVEEIAQLLSAGKLTPAAIKNAQELLS